MKINFRDLFCALSDALDYVENSLFGALPNHAKRVAYMACMMGKKAGLSDSDLSDLTACALLHDNALTEYINSSERAGITDILNHTRTHLGAHCVAGERNIAEMPFYSRVKNVILYHHEQADGNGPFKIKANDIPLYSRLIHLADLVDITCAPEKYAGIRKATCTAFIQKYAAAQFDDESISLFTACMKDGSIERLETGDVREMLRSAFPEKSKEYNRDEIMQIAAIFAHIVDYKSTFTCQHSIGIAEKSLAMAQYYGWDEETQTEYYFAGALHDIGKLAVSTAILEKPDKLTPEEFKLMKIHAYKTWEILSEIDGFEKITEWASYHHEKLDGSGYPFGKKADELDQKMRLMACIDIYQALREERPYKPARTHEQSMTILRQEADEGKIDRTCVEDIGKCFH